MFLLINVDAVLDNANKLSSLGLYDKSDGEDLMFTLYVVHEEKHKDQKAYNIRKAIRDSKTKKYKQSTEIILYDDRPEEKEAHKAEIEAGNQFSSQYRLK